jgi:hypothetical protein
MAITIGVRKNVLNELLIDRGDFLGLDWQRTLEVELRAFIESLPRRLLAKCREIVKHVVEHPMTE